MDHAETGASDISKELSKLSSVEAIPGECTPSNMANKLKEQWRINIT
jgi:hypothetical protein